MSYLKYILSFCLLIGFTSCIEEPEEHSNTVEGNFEALWKIIDTRYCYLDYKEINWDSIYVEYQSRLPRVRYTLEMFDFFADMLKELQDGHVNLYSGFDVSRYHNWYSDSVKNFYSDIIYSDNYLGYDYRTAGGMRYGKINDGKIGYIYYGSFSNGFSSQNMRYIFQQFADCDGLIVDVRNNGGGSLTYAELLASCFFSTETITGYMQHKTGSGHNDFSEPREVKTPAGTAQWHKPVAVLTNRFSYSATNDFVCRIKYAPHVFTVGTWTGGGGGMPLSSELPIGWLVRFSACPMLDADKQHIEWGIAPDYYVTISNADKANDIDTVIETAINIISSKRVDK